MFIEATTLEDGQVAQSEVCILGGGPAGLSLARRLIDAGKRVVVLEAGGLTFDPDSQVFYIGETIGETYFDLDVARLRALGGSMGHWAGACRPLEAWDFEDKPAYRAGGWPIGRADLDPWLQDTAALLEIPSDFTDFSVTDDLRLSGFQWSQMNFGFHWYDWAEAEPNLRIYLNSAAVNLVPGGSGIRAVEVMSGPPLGEQKRWRVEAGTFVVAMGGIENSRFLLWANEQNNGALIPASMPLGRYWMEHPAVLMGDAILTNATQQLFELAGGPQWRGGVGELMLALSPELQAREGLMNNSLEILELAYPRTQQLVADLLCVAPGLGRRMVSALDRNLVCGARFHSMSEQAPHEDNRVVLGQERDPMGVPRVELHWRIHDVDRRSYAQSARLLAANFAANDLGRVRLEAWVDDETLPVALGTTRPGNYHHMGGTRMGTDPTTSVVDANLKVHGLDNLYVAGSSVFPAGGFANPTFTIIQLSLRLAEHLAAR
jgi:choline dehydrogenase-like flavoprotein